MSDGDALVANHVLDYPYARSVGPVLGAFFTALREGRILGVEGADGAVIVPPTEYDPATGDDVGELREVGPGGVVTAWSWQVSPGRKHPLDHPFAWALVRLDGATTAMLHVVDAGDPGTMATGMRVTARFRPPAERRGHVLDLESFVPEVDGGGR